MEQIAVQPLISILIPVYNVELYLVECLESIFSQIDERVQVIAVDDASTDSSKQILIEFQKNFPQLQIIFHDNNKGIATTRNKLLKHAYGEYIWFIDPDDFIANKAYKNILNALRIKPDVVIADYYSFNNGEVQMKYIAAYSGLSDIKIMNNNNLAFKTLLKSSKNYLWNKVFKKSIVADLIYFNDGRKFEDISFALKFFYKINSYIYIKKPIYYYRTRAKSITRDNFINIFDDVSFEWSNLSCFLKNQNAKQELNYVIAYKMLSAYKSAMKQLNELPNNQEKKLELKLLLKQRLPFTLKEIKKYMLKHFWLIRLFKFRNCLR